MPPRRLRPRPAGRRILFETVKKGGGAATGASMTDSKRVGVFSRLGLVHTGSGRGKKAFHHFPPPSFVHSLLRHAARLLGRASERAPTRLSARSVSLTLSLSVSLSLSLATRRWGRAAAVVGRRRSGRPFGFPDSGMMMMHRLLPTDDGRTDVS